MALLTQVLYVFPFSLTDAPFSVSTGSNSWNLSYESANYHMATVHIAWNVLVTIS